MERYRILINNHAYRTRQQFLKGSAPEEAYTA